MLKYLVLFLSVFLISIQTSAYADHWESSIGFNFNHSTYDSASYSWERRYGVSLGYNFTDLSTLELAYENTFTVSHISGIEDSSFLDRVVSVDWVQNILGRDYAFQPYLKGGLGQLVRDATSSNSLGQSTDTKQDQLTVVAGLGLRYYFTRTFAIRCEYTSYLTGGKISSFKDNFGAKFGISWMF